MKSDFQFDKTPFWITCRRFLYGKESEIFQNRTKSDFHFLDGKSRTDTTPRAHSEWHVSVGIGFDWAVSVPTKHNAFIQIFKIFSFKLKSLLKTDQGWNDRARDNIPRRSVRRK